ncbi:MAG: substrate-binding domain-containing protein, partial [Acetanaerobacterium sp.]
IGMVNVNENKDYTVDRLEGYKLALQENDLLFEEENIVNAVNDVNGGMVATMRLLNNSRCTAIFCATDTIAIGAAKAIAEAGLKVPDDISLVGFDGLGHQLLAMPRVTTVQQPIYEMGMMLAQAMLDKLDRKTERISRLIAPVLIEEESVVSIL